MADWILKEAKIVTNDVIERGYVRISGRKITEIGWNEPEFQADDVVTDLQGAWLLPGFIDVHVHGGNGHSFMEVSGENLADITRFHAMHGTTGLLATTATGDEGELLQVLPLLGNQVREDTVQGARVLGIHLEGPFLSIRRIGAQNPKYLKLPDIEFMETCLRVSHDTIRLVTLAPELPGALEVITYLSANKITVGAGHTDASYDEGQRAIAAGLSHSIHTYNGMRPLHHRDPGVLGSLMTHPQVTCEIICDGYHVHPAMARLLFAAKGSEQLVLITDAIHVAGLTDGIYAWDDREIEVHDGMVEFVDRSSLVGSILTMDQAFRNILSTLPISMVEASKMASNNPARVIGVEDRKGSIAIGMDADLVILDTDLSVIGTIVEGAVVYSPTLLDKR